MHFYAAPRTCILCIIIHIDILTILKIQRNGTATATNIRVRLEYLTIPRIPIMSPAIYHFLADSEHDFFVGRQETAFGVKILDFC